MITSRLLYNQARQPERQQLDAAKVARLEKVSKGLVKAPAWIPWKEVKVKEPFFEEFF